MCDPVSITMGVAAVVGGAMTMKAQHDQSRYEKDVADYNAAVDRNTAIKTENVAREKESEARTDAAQLQSRQRAIAASRGASIDFGTALNVQEDTALIGEINAMRIREYGADQAAALRSQADLTESAGKNAIHQGNLAMAGTAVKTVGNVAGSFKQGSGGGEGAVAPKWYKNGKAPSGSAGFGPGL